MDRDTERELRHLILLKDEIAWLSKCLWAIYDLSSSLGVASCECIICYGSGTRLMSCLNDANQLCLSCLVTKRALGKLALMRMCTCVN